MVVLPPVGTLLALVLAAVGGAAVLWFLPSHLTRRSSWGPASRSTAVSLFRGPGVALVLAAFAVELDRLIVGANPGVVPTVLSPESLTIIAELVVIWTAVGIVNLAVRRHVLGEHVRTARLLQYGVYAAGLLGVLVVVLSSPLVPRLATSIWALVGFTAGLIVTYLTVHIVDLVLTRYFAALAGRQPSLETIYRFLRRVLMLAIIVVGVMISTYANFPSAAAALTSIILAAGFLSIVVGLAAQSTLSNLIAGAMVSLSQPFEIGDAVVFPYPNGDWCIVEDIQLNFTVLRTWDLRRLMVPNSMFQSNVIVNYTTVDPTMLVIVYMVVTYESDIDRARAIMEEEARNHPDCLKLGNLPVTHLMDFQGGANQGTGMYGGVDLRLLSAARDQSTAFQVEKDLLHSIRKRFLAEGIQLAYPTQRVLYERSNPPPFGPASRRRPSPG